TLGAGFGEFFSSARGGSAASTSGDGGTVKVLAGRDITVNSGALDVSPQGDNGKGGAVSLIAGTASAGNISVLQDLEASGGGIGAGGSVTLTSSGTVGVTGNVSANGGDNGNGGSVSVTYNSASTFIVASAITTNGVSGSLSAIAGPDNGNGGSISIKNNGTGG